jgi:hypothetical protein
MGNDPPEPRSGRSDEIETLLAVRGHDLGFAGIRVAAGRSGVAVGFPEDPMIHVSWWVVAALVALAGTRFLRRKRVEEKRATR